jgi:hypothetical protein
LSRSRRRTTPPSLMPPTRSETSRPFQPRRGTPAQAIRRWREAGQGLG